MKGPKINRMMIALNFISQVIITKISKSAEKHQNPIVELN